MRKFGKALLLTLPLVLLLCVSTQAMENDMLKVGIKYGDNAMSAANLQNYDPVPFGGYDFGYFDTDRSFVPLASAPAKYGKVTVTADTTYHVQLADVYYDYDTASAAASAYGDAFVAYVDDRYRVHLGSYDSRGEAESAMRSLGAAGAAVGGSATGVTVKATDSGTVLFEFDCGGLRSLGIKPVETGEKSVTWFRGYRYYGGFEYQRITGGDINVINVVNIEDYVKCVIPWEMSNDWPLEALKAQSVCARTYAAAQRKHASQGFDVCTTTDCQVYQGTAACNSHSDSAVDETAGECLYYDGSIVEEAVYYSSNGGASEDCLNVWGSEVPYLKGKTDPYEANVAGKLAKYSWSTTYTSSELTELLVSRGYGIGRVKNLYVSALTDNGNVYEITFVGTNGTRTFQREACRTLLNLRSMRFHISGGDAERYFVNGDGSAVSLSGSFVISGSGAVSAYSARPGDTYAITADGTAAVAEKKENVSTDTFVISGSGNGHNVGLSQWGAYAMADLGYHYRDILNFYYTGVDIG